MLRAWPLALGPPSSATAAIIVATFQQFGLQPGPPAMLVVPWLLQRAWRRPHKVADE